MNSPPAVRPSQSSAERPASKTSPEVWLRDANGDAVRRIPASLGDELIRAEIAERVSGAGHLRLKLGIRGLPNGDVIHGIPAIEIARLYQGDVRAARYVRGKDHSRIRK